MSRLMLAAALALALSCPALARNDDARALIAVQVDRDGVARPVNGHARGIVRE